MDITVFTELEFFFRILIAGICGGLIGYERNNRLKEAGIRTHLIVALAALIMVVSKYGFSDVTTLKGVALDPSRIAAQIVTGVGFLGAGTILVTKSHEIKGLTTAAGLWASACLGLAIGAGFYSCAFISMLFMIVCMYVLPPLERRMTRRAHHMNISLEIESMEKLGSVVGHLHAQGARIFDFEVNRSGSAALPNFLCQFSAVLPDRRDHPELLAELSALDGVILIEEI